MVQKVVFVCTGNTCRSPMAEIMLSHVLEDGAIEVCSRGLQVLSPQPANDNSILEMKKRGLDLSAHSATAFKPGEITEETLVLTMTEFHKDFLHSMYPELVERVYTIKGYVDQQGDVHDPFGGNSKIYEACASELQELINALQGKL